jgi:DNA-directed RNA polymerase II subunit RPB1
VCEVTEHTAFNANEPNPNGLFDTRMGVIENARTCATCLQKSVFCPGHFGHIVLAKPVFYVQFYDIVRKLLRCVCFRCSKCLVSLDSPEVKAIMARKISRQKRWDAMSKLCAKVKRCGQETLDGCGAKQPDKISKTDDTRFRLQWRDAAAPADAGAEDASDQVRVAPGQAGGAAGAAVKEQVFGAEDVLRILRRITDEEAEALGFSAEYNRPEWMICTVLPVPPPAVRPSVRNDTGQRQEDDLTHKLSDIIKYNNALRSKIAKGASHELIEHSVFMLQYHVATLIDNTVPSMGPSQDRAGRMFRSLCERLKHKEGRIRGNLMGKRVDFSARTVITPDPNLSIDELGVPLRIAMNLTFPVVVNAYNRESLRALVLNGPDKYPGAKHVRKTRDGSRTVRLKGYPDLSSIVLEEGDVVERHLLDGDYVLFNRQPSLHKMSMMAHRVRVMEYNTFRLNVCVCASYNADFDGDEMNMHVPQSLQTHHEIRELAAVPLHIISPRYSMPIITIVQDVALGVFRLTQSSVRVSQRQLMNLIASNPLVDPMALPPPADAERKMWTGRQVLSTVLPPSVSIRMASSDKDRDAPDYVPEDHEVVIENGVIRQGILNTAVFSRASRGLVHTTYNSLGPAAVTAMLNNTQKLICDWLVFSVGVSDLVVSQETQATMDTAKAGAMAKVYELLHKVHSGTFENVSTKSDADFLEDQISAALSKGMEAAGKVPLDAGGFNAQNNRMLNMIESGSKGKKINFTQMVACLGPQAIENKRVPDGFDHRTLPHYTKYDDGPESRGFVGDSFIRGLAPQALFFHAMAGRIGLIDTAVRTSETGYLQRRLVKAMEDCKIQHDLTVRNASGFIIQFQYGEDGMDAIKLEFQKLPYLGKDPAAMRATYFIGADVELRGYVREEVMQAFGPEAQQRCERHFAQLLADRRAVIMTLCDGLSDDRPIVYPVNVLRIVESTADLYREVGCAALSDVDPVWLLDEIEALSKELRVGYELLPEPSRDVTYVTWLPILLRCFLSPKVILCKYRLNRLALDRILNQVRQCFYASIAPPSEMVGIVAAQSIGEPTTQLTLNTFHLSGAAAASAITSGVPRMKELMSMSKAIKTPAMTIRMRPEFSTSMAKAKDVLANVQTTRFGDLVKSSSVHYDPSDTDTSIAEDRELMAFYKAFGTLDRAGCNAQASPWLLRFEFDRMKMLDLKVTMLDLEQTLFEFFDEAVSCVMSDDNASRLVCRLRLNSSAEESADILTEIKALEQSIMENTTSVVKGVPGIEKAVLSRPNTGLLKYDPVSDAFVTNDEWTIVTAGSNMVDVMRNDYVDYARTTTNDVYEVYLVLGIEAARQVLITELRSVLGDLPLDHRHLSLLADTMSNRGFFMSIDRHGINHRGELGPLAKCSFEQTTDMLIKAGVFAERDRINGVSANIMLGQVAPCGTGDCEVLLDTEKLMRLAKPVPLELAAEAALALGPGAGVAARMGLPPPGGNRRQAQAAPEQRAEPARTLPTLSMPDADGEVTRRRKVAADEVEIV